MDLYIDRSRVETDWTCRRARWWLTEYDQTGIVPAAPPYYFFFGDLIHKGLEQLLLGQQVEVVLGWATEALEAWTFGSPEEAIEQQAVALGLLGGFGSRVLPKLLETYEVVATEQEHTLTYRPPTGVHTLHWMIRPDACLRDRRSGALVYLEFKTTGDAGPKWLAQWGTKPQLWLGAWALAQMLGEPVEQTLIQGLYKGYASKYGWVSPLTYGYEGPSVTKSLAAEPEAQWAADYRKGWTKRPTRDFPGGLQAWVAQMPDDAIAKVFPRPAPVFTNTRLFADFLEQTYWRECAIAGATAVAGGAPVADPRVFPQSFNRCTPGFGPGCAYERACWMPQVGADPLGSGYYVRRQPHHSQEPAPAGVLTLTEVE